MPLQIRPLSRALGAEIEHIDIGAPMTPEQQTELRRAFLEHHVLLFREQDITPEQHIAFSSLFGELDKNEAVPDYRHPHFPQIVVVTNAKHNGNLSPTRDIGRQWHSDHSMTMRPTLGSLLHARQVPSVGGDTMFTNMHLSYETLSEPLRKMIEPLNAIHDVTNARHLKGRDAAYLQSKRALNPPVLQPVVRRHPETGRKALYINEMMVTRFQDMSDEESHGILQYLFTHSVRPEFTYRHQWRKHDLIMWDNRCTMHNALADFDPQETRIMYRTALEGEPCGTLAS